MYFMENIYIFRSQFWGMQSQNHALINDLDAENVQITTSEGSGCFVG